MAFTRNDIFYHPFDSDNGESYKLWFIPADSSDLSSPTEYEIPGKFFTKDLEYEIGYNDNRPWGQPKAGLMSFSIAFNNFEDIGSNDWTTIRDWILENESPTQRSVNGINTTIRNAWVLERIGDGFTKIDFFGYQERKPGISFDVNSAEIQIEISCIDIYRAIGEASKVSLLENFSGGSSTNYVVDQEYTATVARVWRNPINNIDDPIAKYISVGNIWNAIVLTYTFEYLKAFLRDSTVSISANSTTFLDHWDFYERNGLQDGQVGSSLSISDIDLISTIRDSADVNVIGGLFSSLSENSLISDNNNAFDIIQSFCDAFLCKQQYRHNDNGFYVGASQTIYNLSGNPLSNEQPPGPSPFPKTLDNTDFENFSFDLNPELVGQGITYLVGLHENDPEEIQYQGEDLTGTENDNSVEFKPPVHNHTSNIKTTKTLLLPSLRLAYEQNFMITQKIVYEDTSANQGTIAPVTTINTVHDYCQVDLGQGRIVGSESITGRTQLPSTPNIENVQSWITEIYATSGIGYVTAKAGSQLNGTYGAIESVGVTDLSNARFFDLGENYNIDLSSFGAFPSSITDRSGSVLVNLVANVVRGSVECTFYHYPDF